MNLFFLPAIVSCEMKIITSAVSWLNTNSGTMVALATICLAISSYYFGKKTKDLTYRQIFSDIQIEGVMLQYPSTSDDFEDASIPADSKSIKYRVDISLLNKSLVQGTVSNIVLVIELSSGETLRAYVREGFKTHPLTIPDDAPPSEILAYKQLMATSFYSGHISIPGGSRQFLSLEADVVNYTRQRKLFELLASDLRAPDYSIIYSVDGSDKSASITRVIPNLSPE
jgi:hypothetical protein